MARTQRSTRSARRVFALLDERGVVFQLFEERADITQEVHPSVLHNSVEVTDRADVEVGWVHHGNGALRAPVPVEMSLNQKRRSAFHGGVRVKIKRGPAATFDTRSDAWSRMTEVAQHVALFKEFPGGDTTYEWPSDPPTAFDTTDEFLDAFKAIAAWRDRWNRHVDGKGDEPSRDVTV